ncbi:MAG: hypothetical protein J6039_01720 [Alphaproteobacteria bacterium]|nr:hypothetical protein [Alphaproteobacteria bacterium]
MIARVVIGIILGYLLIAYFPLVLQGLPYILIIAAGGAAFYALRAAPVLAEPVAYGLLAVLLCYIVYLILHHKGRFSAIAQNIKQKKVTLPKVSIARAPRLSILLNMILYTIALTFAFYLIILLIYVR